MTRIGMDKRITALRYELNNIKKRAAEDRTRFKTLDRQAEGFKVEFLIRQFESKRSFLARARVFSAPGKMKQLPISAGVSIGKALLMGIVTKKGEDAVMAALSSFEHELQTLGDTTWAMSLGKKIILAPANTVPIGEAWFSMDSVLKALHTLRYKANDGLVLGDLNHVILVLHTTGMLRRVIVFHAIQVQ